MTTKPKTTKKQKLEISETKTDNGTQVSGELTFLPIEKVQPSPLEPQARRRARFSQTEIEELALSVKKHGLINPITVRPVGDNYEIVAGEMRWMATLKAGHKTISTIVKKLSDNDALEIQLIENLKRKDLHPMDEALCYKQLQEKLGIDENELALRVGKDVVWVKRVLNLNKLIPEAQTDLEQNLITFGHALQIAVFDKSPEQQRQALNFCYNQYWENGKNVPNKNSPVTLKALNQIIQSKILLQLSSAVFKTTDTTLRDDHLPCTKCPQRTGAKGSLFADLHEAKNDRCLNKECFELKTARFIKNTRDETSAAAIAAYKLDEDYKMPVISWMPGGRAQLAEIFKEPIMVDGDYKDTTGKECDNSESGIYLDPNGGRFGKVVSFCRTNNCSVHSKQFSASMKATTPEEVKKAQEERAVRKEEIFDTRVGEPVRRQVLKLAAEKFDENNTVFNHPNSETYHLDLLTRLWKLQCRYSEHTADIIREVLEIKKQLGTESYAHDFRKEIEALSPAVRSKLMFLLLEAFHGELHEAGSFTSQKPIHRIAETFDVNYSVIDAKQRVEQASDKHKDIFRAHLEALTKNEESKIPRIWSEKWKPKND